jgi:argininosuccinate synthase
MAKKDVKKVVLAYSGGLDTSIIVPWLRENYDCEVICYCSDLGQEEELSGLEQKAINSGASACVIDDLRDEFIRNYILPTMQAGAVYERKYLLGTSMARPLIARRQVEVAAEYGADAVAHGCTGKGNDQVRFELTYMALNPRLHVIAPWREWNIRSREDAIRYAAAHNVPIAQTEKKIYSRDRNIWHISHEGGVLEDPWNEPEEEMYTLSVAPENAPDQPQYVVLSFEKGVPVAVDGVRLDLVPLLQRLNALGSAHGIGRVDLVENRLVGMKSHGELESLTMDRETLHYKDRIALEYADLVYNGRWWTPLKHHFDQFVRSTQENVTGDVRLKLYKGQAIVVGRRSPMSLYREDFATFGEEDVYDQSDAEGFLHLYGLPLKVEALVASEKGNPRVRQPDYSSFKRD